MTLCLNNKTIISSLWRDISLDLIKSAVKKKIPELQRWPNDMSDQIMGNNFVTWTIKQGVLSEFNKWCKMMIELIQSLIESEDKENGVDSA